MAESDTDPTKDNNKSVKVKNPAKEGRTMAILSVVMGVLSLITFGILFIPEILGVIFAFRGKRQGKMRLMSKMGLGINIFAALLGIFAIYCVVTDDGSSSSSSASGTTAVVTEAETVEEIIEETEKSSVEETVPPTEEETEEETISETEADEEETVPAVDYTKVYDAAFSSVGSGEGGSYLLSDLNGDGIYELIIGHGTYSGDYETEVWTLKDDGTAIVAGNMDLEYVFLEAPDGNGIYATRELRNHQFIDRWTLAGNVLMSEEVVNRNLEDDEDYYSEEHSDEIIETASLNDKSLLAKYNNLAKSNTTKASGKTTVAADYSQYDYVSPGYDSMDGDITEIEAYVEPYKVDYNEKMFDGFFGDPDLEPFVYRYYYEQIDGYQTAVGLNMDGIKKLLTDKFRYDYSGQTDWEIMNDYAKLTTVSTHYYNPWDSSLTIDDIRTMLYSGELQCLSEKEVNDMSNYEVTVRWFYIMDDYLTEVAAEEELAREEEAQYTRINNAAQYRDWIHTNPAVNSKVIFSSLQVMHVRSSDNYIRAVVYGDAMASDIYIYTDFSIQGIITGDYIEVEGYYEGLNDNGNPIIHCTSSYGRITVK